MEYSNTASVATLSSPITAGAATCLVSAFTGWPTPVNGVWAIIARGTPSAEVVLVTNVAGSTLTITRGQGGTADTSHGAGDTVEHIAPAGHFADAETHQAATSNVHGATGSIVGTSGGQTIQDKTYRGAHRSVHSDALPAGVSASFLCEADSAAARDGFVHRTTLGPPSSRGFLLEVSGTPRFQVFNTGKVQVTPASGVALEVDGVTQLDGDVDLNGALDVSGAATLSTLATSGGATVGGTLGVTGTSTLGTTNTGVLTSSGAISGASVAATGAVTGASVSATGAVAGASAAFTGAVTADTGSRVVVSADNSADVVTPVTGQIYWDTVTRCFYRYTGSVWTPTAGTIAGRVVTTAGAFQTGLAGAEFTIPKLQMTGATGIELSASHTYTLNLSIEAVFAGAAGSSFLFRIRKAAPSGGAIIAKFLWISQVDGFSDYRTFSLPYKPSADATDAEFYVTCQRLAGTATGSLFGDKNSAFWVDDQGADSSVWVEVA